MVTKYDVYGLGNALVDIQAKVEDPFVQEIGKPKGAMSLVNADFQAELLTRLEETDLHTVSGGSGANTMIGVANLGGVAKYAGKVGDDLFGSFYTQDLAKAGVHYEIPHGKDPTGTCVILITPDAERTMFTHLGISIQLTPDDIDENSIKNSKWVYIEGYLWDSPGPKAASLKTMELAKKHDVKVAYSFSDPFCVKRAKDDFLNLTQNYIDLVFCNEEEACCFANVSHPDEALRYITSLGAGVAMTQEVRGSKIRFRGMAKDIRAYPVKAIDSTGAGDLYAAGVLYGLTHDYDLEQSGHLGSYCASRIVGTLGPRLKESINPKTCRI